MLNFSRTKLVCTIGPASNSPDTIKKMMLAGMNVVRLNFSHGTHETHSNTIHTVRKVAAELGVSVGILQDLCGPKIRLGKLPEEGIKLLADSRVIFASSGENCGGCIPIDYPGIHKELRKDERLLISDGMMEVVVEKIVGHEIYCRVISGGVAFSRKGINMPQSNLQVQSFSKKDKDDLMMGLDEKVDFVALSFVRSAKDMDEVRAILSTKKEDAPKLIAKIEKPQAVENLDEILAVVDGVMVARGDLGVEMPLEEIPHVQKKIIRSARLAGRMVITATQMLASMVTSPRPTRGETTDVANAVLDGTDALMLSDETANGQYPIDAVETLNRIARTAEPYAVSSLSLDNAGVDDKHVWTVAIGRAACWLAKDVGASAIVSFTSSGYTAYSISRFRPNCQILALTISPEMCGRMSLIWGTKAIPSDMVQDTDMLVATAKSKALESGVAKKGDTIIVTAGIPFGESKTTSFLRIIQI